MVTTFFKQIFRLITLLVINCEKCANFTFFKKYFAKLKNGHTQECPNPKNLRMLFKK